MKNSKVLIISTVIFVFSLVCIMLVAGPTIIRDNRITDLAATPTLGRGYSIATNTFQSSCMRKVIVTQPSYDMHYEFISSESSSEATSSSKSSSASTIDSTATSTYRRGSTKSSYSNRFEQMATQTSVVIDKVKYYNHDMFAVIDLYSYYASLNEANSKMSVSAIQLLKKQDLPGFFSSCGPYYIRSIGRKAVFISNFSYSTVESSRDSSFESQLKQKLKGFSSVSSKSKGGCGSPDTYRTYTSSVETQNIVRNEYKFAISCKNKRLRIESHAYGMGKKKGVTLISYDLDTFRDAIEGAFQAMQMADTGRVATIEVVPWVENTEFQEYAGLEKTPDIYRVERDLMGNPFLDATGQPKRRLIKRGQLLYEKKMLLSENAEFLMEIERADRNLFNLYYKSKLCRKDIDMNYKKDGTIMKQYKNASVVNNRTGERQPLTFLDKLLTKEYIKGLLSKERMFMYGTESIKDSVAVVAEKATAAGAASALKKKEKGGRACIHQIMDGGIYTRSYRMYKACADIEEDLAESNPRAIEDYCMPTLAP
ncbi:MAG: hypothetical protein GY754_45670 [bacterium]|nr:hypothetical protein [bacterium]